MARRVVFTPRAWDDYLYWQRDAKSLERVNRLIVECSRDPFRGLGKPEPLKGQLAGFWSRRINDADRLVYRATSTDLEVLACRFHYGES